MFYRIGLFLFLILFSSPVFAQGCTLWYNNTIAPAAGFNTAYNPLLPSAVEPVVNCQNPPSIPISIGLGSAGEAVWNTVYVCPSSSDCSLIGSWTPFQLSGSVGSGLAPGYFRGSASGTLNISSSDLTGGWNFIAYLDVQFVNGAWSYRNGNALWSLQAITTAATTYTISDIGLTNSVFIVPASSGTTIGTLSATMSPGTFTGTIVFSTADLCTGSPSADNGNFQITGSDLQTATGSLTAGSYKVCFSATDPLANNTFYKAFTITAQSASITAVGLSNDRISASASPGTNVGTLSATLTSGSFSGTFALSTASSCAGAPSTNNSLFAVSGTNLNTGGGTVVAGTYQVCVSATESGILPYYKAFTIFVGGVPVSISMSPSGPIVVDNSTAGTVVSTASVTMSDGSTYAGTLSLCCSPATDVFDVSGLNIVVKSNLGPVNDGPYDLVITPN